MKYILLIILIVCITFYATISEYFEYKKEKERNKEKWLKSKRGII